MDGCTCMTKRVSLPIFCTVIFTHLGLKSQHAGSSHYKRVVWGFYFWLWYTEVIFSSQHRKGSRLQTKAPFIMTSALMETWEVWSPLNKTCPCFFKLIRGEVMCGLRPKGKLRSWIDHRSQSGKESLKPIIVKPTKTPAAARRLIFMFISSD